MFTVPPMLTNRLMVPLVITIEEFVATRLISIGPKHALTYVLSMMYRSAPESRSVQILDPCRAMRILERSKAEAATAWMPVDVGPATRPSFPRGRTIGVRRWLDCRWCVVCRSLFQPMEQLVAASGHRKADVVPQLYAQQLDDGHHVAGFGLPIEISKVCNCQGRNRWLLDQALQLAVERRAQPLLDVVTVEVGEETLLEA